MSDSTTALIEKPPEYAGGGVLAGGDPAQVVSCGVAAANILADIIQQKKLYTVIRGRRHVLAEGWCLLGGMCGILPREVSVDEDADGNVIAVVELVRTSDLAVIGRASAMCGVDEPEWSKRPKFARRSMAVTRATGKAFRLSLAWIVKLAGYDPCPLEEVEDSLGPSKPGTTIDMSDVGVYSVDANNTPSTPDQHNAIKTMAQRLHFSTVAAKELVKKHGGNRLVDLTIAQADAVIRDLEAYERDGEVPF